MSIDLFGDDTPQVVLTHSGRRLGPQGGKHYVQPRGYAGTPGTGPEGKQCRHCAHYTHKGTGGGSFPACGLIRPNWTSGRATDILARSPSCNRFEEGE